MSGVSDIRPVSVSPVPVQNHILTQRLGIDRAAIGREIKLLEVEFDAGATGQRLVRGEHDGDVGPAAGAQHHRLRGWP